MEISGNAGGYKFIQADGHFKPGTDTVLLSEYPRLRRDMKICDLGCGSGALTLLLAARREDTIIDGIELLEKPALAARKNVELNGLSKRIRIINHDLRNIKDILPSGRFDLVVSNPPYFEAGHGKSPKDDGLKSARSDVNCTIDDICAAASYLTRWGGYFTVVFRPERLVDLFYSMRKHGFEPKRMCLVKAAVTKNPSLILADSKRGGNKGLIIESDFILKPDIRFGTQIFME